MGFYIGQGKASRPREGFIPHPKLKLLEQVSEVMRFKHYLIRTETTYCDWIRRYVKFDAMGSRDDLQPPEPKIELFLSDLAIYTHVLRQGGSGTKSPLDCLSPEHVRGAGKIGRADV